MKQVTHKSLSVFCIGFYLGTIKKNIFFFSVKKLTYEQGGGGSYLNFLKLANFFQLTPSKGRVYPNKLVTNNNKTVQTKQVHTFNVERWISG